jgi:hypothetical protein
MADVDTVDLTGSSPEPETRPRIPPQQQRLPTYFKSKPRTDISGNTSASFASGPKQQRRRRINPYHMEQIVNSTDSDALRGVLLNLCKVSPALSEAIARGLAPHSAYAQGLMRQQGQTLGPSVSRPFKAEISEDDARYAHVKQQVLQKKALRMSPSPSSSRTPKSSSARMPQTEPRVKRERQPDEFETHQGSAPILSVPGAYPSSARQPTPLRSPLRESSSSTVANRTSKPTFVSTTLAHHEKPKAVVGPTFCQNCHQTIENEFESCFYHPGRCIMVDGVETCQSCNEPVSDLGCKMDLHVMSTGEDGETSGTAEVKRAQSPSKRPRIS